MKASQQGLAVLALCLLLSVAATWLALAVTQHMLARQRILAADYHGLAVMATADTGLAFGISWLETNRPQWTPLGANSEMARPDSLPVPAGNPLQIRLAVTYRRELSMPDVIHIRADASAAAQHYQMSQCVVRINRQIMPVAGSWVDFE